VKHQHQFRLIIKAIGATTAKVTNIACHFCITFEKEEGGNKRKATSNVEYFESFRTNNYLSHLQGQHLLKLINSTNNLLCSCKHIVKDILSRVQLSMAMISRPTSKRHVLDQQAFSYVGNAMWRTYLCFPKHRDNGIRLLFVGI
jgi:hypothetical protein